MQASDFSSVIKLNWLNSAINSLPIDECLDPNPRQVRGYNYSLVNTTPVENPRIVSICDKAMREALDITKEQILQNEEEWEDLLAGNTIPEGSTPISHCYCGHQFGVFAGQLGDGRAITLGDIENRNGEIWELQLKGAGKTPYSRFADGRAVLRSSIREYLCSEAMYALGIPTTRCGSIVTSDSTVVRDLLYDGHPIDEKCTIVMRLAPTFIRFGSFEICLPTNSYSGKAGPSHGEGDSLLPQLFEYTIEHFYQDYWAKFEQKESTKEEMFLKVFKEITRRTAETVSKWQGVGFCHGVLNTDNMSILGLTIDYGPFGFLDHFNLDHICNHSDKEGRYSYQNQPSMCKWNLIRLAIALEKYIPEAKSYVTETFDIVYTNYFMQEFKQKLGIQKLQEGDLKFFVSLQETLKIGGFDYTNFYRNLHKITIPESQEEGNDLESQSEAINTLFNLRTKKDLKCKLSKPKFAKLQLQKLKEIMTNNPDLLRMVGQDPKAIERELAKDAEYEKLMKAEDQELDHETREVLESWLKVYRIRLFQDFTHRDDDSQTLEQFDQQRVERMQKKNPKFVLRNHLAQECIEKAEEGDYSMVDQLLYVLENPFDEHEDMPESWSSTPPKEAYDICVSCSS